MALIQIGSAGNMVKQAVSAIGSNSITNALGIDFGTILTPSKFLTKFTPSTIFSYRSLAYELRTAKNFDVIFHWHPKTSQIRSMFSNAFSASDTDEINLLIRDIQLPNIQNTPIRGNSGNPKFRGTIPGYGVNADGGFIIRILSTEFSFVSHCFYQWLSETESPFWLYGANVASSQNSLKLMSTVGKTIYNSDTKDVYKLAVSMEDGQLSKMIYIESESDTAPFTRADIEIKYYSSNMKELHSVWFMGAFPTSIQLESPENMNNFIDGYAVSFDFDSVCISSPFTFNSESSGGNITNATMNALTKAMDGLGGGTFGNTASWTAGLYDDTLTQIGNTYLSKLSRKLNKITKKAGEKVSSKVKSLESKFTA